MGCPEVLVLSHLELRVIEGKVGVATLPRKGLANTPGHREPTARQKPDSFLVRPIAQQPHGVVAIGHHLLDVSRCAIVDRVDPFLDVVADFLSDGTVLQNGAPYEHGRVYQSVHAASDELVHAQGHVLGIQRRIELVQGGCVTPVVAYEDPWLGSVLSVKLPVRGLGGCRFLV